MLEVLKNLHHIALLSQRHSSFIFQIIIALTSLHTSLNPSYSTHLLKYFQSTSSQFSSLEYSKLEHPSFMTIKIIPVTAEVELLAHKGIVQSK